MRMSFREIVLSKLSLDKNNPIDSEKRLISFVQKLVGIHDVFGDRPNLFSFPSVLGIFLFAGSFIYTGPFSQIVYLVQVFPDKIETFKALNCISATCVPISKYIFMWVSRAKLNAVIRMSREGLSDIPPGGRGYSEMMDTLQKGRLTSWLVICSQAGSHILYLVLPALFTILGDHRYLPNTPGDSYGLSPKYETPFYEATYVITCFATGFSAINQTGYIALFVTILAHELGHFYVIIDTLNEIHDYLSTNTVTNDDNAFQRDIENKLTFCIKHHQFLMRFHDIIRDFYKIIFAAQYLMMVVVLVTTLQTMNAWNFSNTVLTAVTGILPLFIYCFGGELLTIAGEQLCQAIYSSGWENMKVKQAKKIMFMLCLSQRPLHLTAADFFIMNRETFGTVVQVVYKIYAVFN